MGARGFISFVSDGAEKMAFVGQDSYPDAVGLHTLRWLREASQDLPRLRTQMAALRMVQLNDQPTSEDIQQVKASGVSLGNAIDWGELLYPTEGYADQMITAGAAIDITGYQYSGEATWGYVIDLDQCRFDVYRGGWQGVPHDPGRYTAADASDGSDVDVTLLRSWPLKSLPADARFLAICGY